MKIFYKIPRRVRNACGIAGGAALLLGAVAAGDSWINGRYGLPSKVDVIEGSVIGNSVLYPPLLRMNEPSIQVYDVVDQSGNTSHFKISGDAPKIGDTIRIRITRGPDGFFTRGYTKEDRHSGLGDRHYVMTGERVNR